MVISLERDANNLHGNEARDDGMAVASARPCKFNHRLVSQLTGLLEFNVLLRNCEYRVK